ncbi:MAG TPA: phenylalanine--tRNA ligase subunit beta [Candidatus Babeliales bacterium]|nr:phenylalanine--tRNA ligase subunit beta [Candidatus Babeliales bacterium]
MKISLNWIFDHIKGELSRIDVAQLVDTFIRTTAEIEGWKKVTVNVDELTLAEVVNINGDTVIVRSAEHKKEYILPKRTDALVGSYFLVFSAENNKRWATSVLFGGIKDMVLPAMYCPENLRAGGWKSTIELQDYVVEIDNKSINSRPDLWGHRGLAREIAAILNLQLRPLEEFVTQKDSIPYKNTAPADKNNPCAITIETPQICDRFATFYIPSVAGQASHLNMIVRLSRLDSRSIDFLVDATNYVMLDLGQPMHAFDADAFQTQQITIAYARDKEKLALLDGETIELTTQDLVITDGGTAISLAGVMGGATTGISQKTKSVLLEAAHFDPVIIRRTAARHKKRTEASMRFEKSLDPCHNTDALKRFLFLLDRAGITYTASEHIVSLGECPQQKIIVVGHAFIEARLGVIIKVERIIEILEKVSFGVVQSAENNAIVYAITVPSFRATKDVKIPEDIVEEVGRYIGYDTLPRVMPSLQLRPLDLHKTYITRAIKHFCSYGLQMRELYGYSFFDESVLRELAWQPTDAVAIKNPISENYIHLVTTLQPHLLKAVGENSIAHVQLRFYEWGRVWHMSGDAIVEQKSLSGIFFTQPSSLAIDFYAGKEMLMRMFDELHMEISWQPNDGTDFSWMMPHQTAILKHNGVRIGIAGMVESSVVNAISAAGGSAFMFEVNADYLLDYRKPVVRFNPLSKYPSVRRDVSMLISAAITADVLTDVIKSVDKRIELVTLIDFFTKPEWKDQKAMTFHVEMCDKEKTLTSDEVEGMWSRVIAQLQLQGAVIR